MRDNGKKTWNGRHAFSVNKGTFWLDQPVKQGLLPTEGLFRIIGRYVLRDTLAARLVSFAASWC